MNLLVGLFLVLINSFNSATAKIPNSEGINVLVAYLFTCIFFVFCALAGYAGICQETINPFSYNQNCRNIVHEEPSISSYRRSRHTHLCPNQRQTQHQYLCHWSSSGSSHEPRGSNSKKGSKCKKLTSTILSCHIFCLGKPANSSAN